MDQLPTEGSTREPIIIGINKVTLVAAEMGTSKASGNEQMTVSFRTESGGNFKEFYQISDKPFMMFKLRRLIEATGLVLGDADVTLQDICKMLPRDGMIAAMITENKSGYPEVDYSEQNGGMGLYTYAEQFGAPVTPAPTPIPVPQPKPVPTAVTPDLQVAPEQTLDINAPTQAIYEPTAQDTAKVEEVQVSMADDF